MAPDAQVNKKTNLALLFAEIAVRFVRLMVVFPAMLAAATNSFAMLASNV